MNIENNENNAMSQDEINQLAAELSQSLNGFTEEAPRELGEFVEAADKDIRSHMTRNGDIGGTGWGSDDNWFQSDGN
jgi:hypothetical protein